MPPGSQTIPFEVCLLALIATHAAFAQAAALPALFHQSSRLP